MVERHLDWFSVQYQSVGNLECRCHVGRRSKGRICLVRSPKVGRNDAPFGSDTLEGSIESIGEGNKLWK